VAAGVVVVLEARATTREAGHTGQAQLTEAGRIKVRIAQTTAGRGRGRVVDGERADAASNVPSEGKEELVDSCELLGGADIERDGARVEGRGVGRVVRAGIGLLLSVGKGIKPLHHA
jgi:hypothetical protein